MAADAAVKAVGGATPWGAIIGGVTGIVSSIIGAGIAKKELALKENEQKFQHALGGLNNQQNYVLQQQLNGAKNATERYAILADAVTKIKLQGVQNAGAANTQKTITIIGVIVLAIVVLVIVKRK